jgi:hypothetical protein
LQVAEPLSRLNEIFVLIGIAVYIFVVLSMSIGLWGLAIFHFRLSYIGMTNDAFASRSTREPGIWSINTVEYRKKLKEASKHADVGEDQIINIIF